MDTFFWVGALLWISFIGIQDVHCQGEITFEKSLQTLARWSNTNTSALLNHRFIHLLHEDFLSFAFSKNVTATKDFNVSSQCVSDCEAVLSSLFQTELYALQMIDATGKPYTNILQGNFQWLGSYSDCKLVNTTNKYTFDSRYCTVAIQDYQTPALAAVTVTLGVCLPNSCSAEDVRGLANAALPTGIYATYSQCQVFLEERELDVTANAIIGLLSALAGIILCSTLFHTLVSLSSAQTQELNSPADEEEPPLIINEVHSVEDQTPLLQTRTRRILSSTQYALNKITQPFSLFINGDKILTVGPSSESNLSAVHGIRFLSMSWVILGHTYAFITTFIQNPAHLLPVAKRFTFQAILNATVSVDSFFVLSGVLTAYLLLRELDAKNGVIGVSWGKYYFHRFWRLTPPYMLVLGAYVTLFYYIGEGPNWPRDIDPGCRVNWWTNLLYINNVVAQDKPCFGWAWYLANDMQFFMISPFLVVPLFASRVIVRSIGWVLNLLVLVGSMIATGVITHKHGYPASTPSYIGDPQVAQRSANYMKDVYFAPWCRIGPYIIGLIVGYLLFKTKRVIRLHKVVVVLGWLAAAAMNLAVLYGLYGVTHGHNLSPGVNAFYAAVHRNVWAVGIGWVIFACSTGHGGPVNRLLSWSGLVPLSRLTYMAYLIHPIVIYYSYLSFENPILFSDVHMIYLFMGHLSITYALSFVLTLAFEAPMIALEKMCLPR